MDDTKNYNPSAYFAERLKIRKLIGYLKRDDPQYREQNVASAASALELLYGKTEYLSVAQWIGDGMLAAERARRSSFWFGWWRAWRIRRDVRRNLRRIDFGNQRKENRQ